MLVEDRGSSLKMPPVVTVGGKGDGLPHRWTARSDDGSVFGDDDEGTVDVPLLRLRFRRACRLGCPTVLVLLELGDGNEMAVLDVDGAVGDDDTAAAAVDGNVGYHDDGDDDDVDYDPDADDHKMGNGSVGGVVAEVVAQL